MRPLVLLLALALAAACASPPPSLDGMVRESLRDPSDPDRDELARLEERRRERVERVLALLAAGEVATPEEELQSAALLLDSDDPDVLARAEELALRAARAGDDRGFPLAAEAIDRQLLVRGLPQRYGTQYVLSPATGRWELYRTDPRTSDAQRSAMGLPSLAEARARAAPLNRP